MSKTGYVLKDDNTLANEKSNCILPGYDNLYQSNYYKTVISNFDNSSYDKALLKHDFEIINQIYIESLKNIGSTGDNLNESLIYYKREDPLIFKLINDDPKILEMLYEIRDMEDKQEYLTRLDALIFQCESYLHKNESTKDNTSCHLK